MVSFEGGMGSIEPFIESVPQTFIQTGFFVLGKVLLLENALNIYLIIFFFFLSCPYVIDI